MFTRRWCGGFTRRWSGGFTRRRRAAAAVAFVHNHPSGNPDPSRDDREITARLVEVYPPKEGRQATRHTRARSRYPRQKRLLLVCGGGVDVGGAFIALRPVNRAVRAAQSRWSHMRIARPSSPPAPS